MSKNLGGLVIAGIIGCFCVFGAAAAERDDQIIARLNRTIDLTIEAMVATEKAAKAAEANAKSEGKDTSFIGRASFGHFLGQLKEKYNAANPPLVAGYIDVAHAKDAKILAYNDVDSNSRWDSAIDKGIHTVEFDGRNSRIIVQDVESGAILDRRLDQQQRRAGHLIPFILNNQSTHGNPSVVENKQPTSPSEARANARARAGSGSHSVGK